MTVAKKLDKASGIFFFTGFLLSKLQYIPSPLVSALFRFISLGIYSLAYLTWFLASLLHPDQKEQHYRKWYGFAQIKEQFLFSSLIGFIATILSVAAVFVPPLLPIAALLFFIGNLMWAIGEYHKFKSPPPLDQNFSMARQKSYVSYAATSTAISLVAAIAATLIFFFPPLAIPITIFSVLVCIGLGALAFEFWLNSNFGKVAPTPVTESYQQINESLGPSPSPDSRYSPEPGFFKDLFSSPTNKSSQSYELLVIDRKETPDEHSLSLNSSL